MLVLRKYKLEISAVQFLAIYFKSWDTGVPSVSKTDCTNLESKRTVYKLTAQIYTFFSSLCWENLYCTIFMLILKNENLLYQDSVTKSHSSHFSHRCNKKQTILFHTETLLSEKIKEESDGNVLSHAIKTCIISFISK